MLFKVTRTGQHWEDEGSPLEVYNTMLLVRLETFNRNRKETHWLKNFVSLDHLMSFVGRHGQVIVSMFQTGSFLYGRHPALMEQCVGEIEIYDDYRE